MSVGTSSSHLGGDPNGFHGLFWRDTVAQRRFGVSLDAVWALRDMRNCHGDELLSPLQIAHKRRRLAG
jgi:hypothetical protein